VKKHTIISILVVISIFLVIGVFSSKLIPAYGEFYKEIKNVSLSLKGETELITAKNINSWVEKNINYEYHYFPIGIRATWEERRGDCTDKSILKKIMLSYAGIESRLAHGYVFEDKHDTIYIKINKTYYNFEGIDFIGWGRW